MSGHAYSYPVNVADYIMVCSTCMVYKTIWEVMVVAGINIIAHVAETPQKKSDP